MIETGGGSKNTCCSYTENYGQLEVWTAGGGQLEKVEMRLCWWKTMMYRINPVMWLDSTSLCSVWDKVPYGKAHFVEWQQVWESAATLWSNQRKIMTWWGEPEQVNVQNMLLHTHDRHQNVRTISGYRIWNEMHRPMHNTETVGKAIRLYYTGAVQQAHHTWSVDAAMQHRHWSSMCTMYSAHWSGKDRWRILAIFYDML